MPLSTRQIGCELELLPMLPVNKAAGQGHCVIAALFCSEWREWIERAESGGRAAVSWRAEMELLELLRKWWSGRGDMLRAREERRENTVHEQQTG